MRCSAWTASGATNAPADDVRVGRRAAYALVLTVAAAIVAIDQVTKQLALDALADGPIHLISGWVSLRLAFNPGGAFGILRDVPVFFLVATIVVIGLILYWTRHAATKASAVALGLVLGGGLGNLFDRVARDFDGRVVDFIDVHFWPVFNVADSAIVVGIAVILLTSRREPD